MSDYPIVLFAEQGPCIGDNWEFIPAKCQM